MNTLHLFYKHGLPTDIIYNGNHTQFTKSELTKTKKNKYVFTAQLDELSFIHDASHLIAIFEKHKKNPTLYQCNERKDNNKLHGPSTAYVIEY